MQNTGTSETTCHTHEATREGKTTESEEGRVPFSRFFTFLEDRVIRMRWMVSIASSTPAFPGFIGIAMLHGAGRVLFSNPRDRHQLQTGRLLRGTPLTRNSKRLVPLHCRGFLRVRFRFGGFQAYQVRKLEPTPVVLYPLWAASEKPTIVVEFRKRERRREKPLP
jgi:hypothetical protein